LLLFFLLLGQTTAFIDYDFAESLGLQESQEKFTELGVAMNKGFGVGDTIIYVPFLVLGLIGLWSRKIWGVFTMAGAMAITAYWPMVSLFILLFARDVPGFTFSDYTTYTILLTGITLYGIWGFWYLYRHSSSLTTD
jgi:hypothetical protein